MDRNQKTHVKPRSKRVHLVNLFRWRSAVALASCLVTIVASFTAIGYSFVSITLKEVREMFRWFTVDSNLLTALAAVLIVPFAIEGMGKKRLTYPKWVQRIHYAGTICLAVTMFFAVACISWYDPVLAFGGVNFFLHIISPVMIIVSFFMVESNHKLDRRDNLLSLIPITSYGALYFYHVIIAKNWNDHYNLNAYIPFYVSAVLMFLVSYTVGWLIRMAYNRLLAVREKKLKQIWNDDLDPVSIRIEIYSLGYHAGLYEEEDDLSIPFDILEEVSDRFDIKLEVLSRAYTKGAIDGLKDKKST